MDLNLVPKTPIHFKHKCEICVQVKQLENPSKSCWEENSCFITHI